MKAAIQRAEGKMKEYLLVWLMAASLFLSGCGAKVNHVSFNPPIDQPIKKIGLPTILAPPFILDDPTNPALSFGLIGGLAYAADIKGKAGELDRNFHYDQVMQEALISGLEKLGYEVVALAAERPSSREFIDYKNMTGEKVDAVLDIATWTVGYSSVSYPEKGKVEKDGFRPALRVVAQLVSPATNKVFYSETFMYGQHNAFMTATNLKAPPDYYFPSFEAMRDNREKVFKGLDLATKELAAEIVRRLEK